MTLFPLANLCGRKQVVRISGAFRANIEYRGGPKKMHRRNLVDSRLPWRKMDRRVQMRPVMLQHPEAPREVAVLLHVGIVLGLETPFVTRPRYQSVVDGIREVQDSRLPGENPFEHGVRGAECLAKPQFQPCARFPGTRLP